MNYSLEIISGTEQFVVAELAEKYPTIQPNQVSPTEILIQSNLEIDDFRNLYSVLRISGNNLTRNLFRREWQIEHVPAGVNPALAYILCMAAGLKEEDQMLDPFCGGGTIPITASKYFNVRKAFACDLSGKAIEITKRNFQSAEIVKEKYFTLRSNVSMLKFPKEYFDKIITNLPFGVRVGTHENNEKIYKIFAKKCASLIKPDGKVVILTQEKQLIFNMMSQSGFKLVKKFDLRQGGLSPVLCIYKKIA
jgi:23S rRNA G2445 N2-methylase RlmL